jgi:hypothetical protein
MAVRVEIRSPIWKYPRSVGIAEGRIIDDLEIEILYETRSGVRLYPGRYYIDREKALTYPTQILPSGVILRIIPIADLKTAPVFRPPAKVEKIRAIKEANQMELFAAGKDRLREAREKAGVN